MSSSPHPPPTHTFSAAMRRRGDSATPPFPPPLGRRGPSIGPTPPSAALYPAQHSHILAPLLPLCLSLLPLSPQGDSARARPGCARSSRSRMCIGALIQRRSCSRRFALFARRHPAVVQRRGRSPVGGPVPSTPVRTYPSFRGERRPKAGVSRKNGVCPVDGIGRRPPAGPSLLAGPGPGAHCTLFLYNCVLSLNIILSSHTLLALLVAFCDPV